MGALAVSLLVAYGLRTYERNADWTDQATLFTRTAQDSPYSSKAHKNYAVALRDAGRFDEARLAYQRAWELYPRDEGIAFGLGEVCDRLGRSSEAELWYRKALAIDPKHVGSWNNLCRLYVLQGRWAEAEQACRAGLRQNAAHANLWKGLGLTWLNRGNADAGREALLIALRLAPKDESLRGYIESLAAPKEDEP
jgi:Flp pilus assembly protein TadD